MASVTITTTSTEDAILAPAFGEWLHLGRNATVQEVKQALCNFMRQIGQDYERRQNMAQFVPDPINPQ